MAPPLTTAAAGVHLRLLRSLLLLLLSLAPAALGATSAASQSPIHRSLPEGKLIAGYATRCDSDVILREAVRGVNVVIWSFINLKKDAGGKQTFGFQIDTECVARVAKELKDRGLQTSHLISVGGWDAQHPDTSFSTEEWWSFFEDWNAKEVAHPELGFGGFEGIDWDIEGVNDLASPNNEITPACIQLIGELSQKAKQAGYIVTMVPPESYLNPFLPSVDLSLRHSSYCMPDFEYAGQNAYAVLLAKYGLTPNPDDSKLQSIRTFDLVSVQLYESWSFINCMIRTGGNPSQQLQKLIVAYEDGADFNFSTVPEFGIPPTMHLSVAPEQLMIGFSFGAGNGNKSIYLPPDDLASALNAIPLESWPRGAFFWDIKLDANRPLNGSTGNCSFAAGFNRIFHTR